MTAVKHPKYVLIDTNPYIFLFEQGFKNPSFQRKPTELSTLEELATKVKNKDIVVLLPEIVELECLHLISTKKTELDTVYQGVIKRIQDESTSDKKVISDNSSQLIQEYIQDICCKEKDVLDRVGEKFNEFLNLDSIIRIPLDHRIFIEGYKRGLQGKKPYSLKRNKDKDDRALDNQVINDIQPDCLIIESVKSYLSEIKVKDYHLFICTNDGHFYKDPLEKTEIDNSIKSEFANVTIAHDLTELVKILNGITESNNNKVNIENSSALDASINSDIQEPTQEIAEGVESVEKNVGT